MNFASEIRLERLTRKRRQRPSASRQGSSASTSPSRPVVRLAGPTGSEKSYRSYRAPSVKMEQSSVEALLARTREDAKAISKVQSFVAIEAKKTHRANLAQANQQATSLKIVIENSKESLDQLENKLAPLRIEYKGLLEEYRRNQRFARGLEERGREERAPQDEGGQLRDEVEHLRGDGSRPVSTRRGSPSLGKAEKELPGHLAVIDDEEERRARNKKSFEAHKVKMQGRVGPAGSRAPARPHRSPTPEA